MLLYYPFLTSTVGYIRSSIEVNRLVKEQKEERAKLRKVFLLCESRDKKTVRLSYGGRLVGWNHMGRVPWERGDRDRDSNSGSH